MSHPGRHGGPRLQDFITEVGTRVDAGDDEVNLAFSQRPYAQEHTITWCAADGIGTRPINGRGSFRGSNAVMKGYCGANAALLFIGGNNEHLPDPAHRIGERLDAGRINTIVVCD